MVGESGGLESKLRTLIPTVWSEGVPFRFRFRSGIEMTQSIKTQSLLFSMDSNFYFNSNSDSNFGHEPSASKDLVISILILSHSDSHFDFDSGREPSTPYKHAWRSYLNFKHHHYIDKIKI